MDLKEILLQGVNCIIVTHIREKYLDIVKTANDLSIF